MAAVTTVVDGKIKFREGRKWKNRWCVLKKPSPVADHLQLVLFKDVSEACKSGAKPKAVYTLDSFFGLVAEINVDKEQHVLAVICLKNVFLMAFELRESMIRFEIKIRESLGEERQFLVKAVKAPSNCKLPKDQLCLMIHDTRLCLTAHIPPKILLSWNVEDLRRFVAREDKFIFEGGARCGKGSGLFALQSEQAADIADIINLASSGKMSNCHRKFKNRSSQIELSSHFISPLSSPSSSCQPHHRLNSPSSHLGQQGQGSKSPLNGALPTTLNCCLENQTGSAESEDWSWYKRHSVSVTDHRRISALREKSCMENRDSLIMGLYDTPPNHNREVNGCLGVQQPMYDHPKSNMPAVPTSVFDAEAAVRPPGCHESSPSYENQTDMGLNDGIRIVPTAECHQEVDSVNGSLDYDETLHRLKKQEYDLQREMLLLDEMLQSCTTDSLDSSKEQMATSDDRGKTSDKAANSDHTHAPAPNFHEQEQKLETFNSVCPFKGEPDTHFNFNNHRTQSGLPHLPYNDFDEIISGNVAVMKSNPMSQSGIFEKQNKTVTARLNSSLPEGSMVSPLFHAKLNSIPPSSCLNAPLPYVNLSGFDDESANHVHLPGSADRLRVTRGSSCHGLNSSNHSNKTENNSGLRRGHYSTTSLNVPVAMSSLTNLNQNRPEQDSPHRRLQGRQSLDSATRSRNSHTAHFMLKQAIEGPSFANAASHHLNHQEVLRVKMEPTSNCPSRDVSFVSSTKSLSFDTSEDHSNVKTKSDIVDLLTVDSDYNNLPPCVPKREAIYENLPLVKDNPPPPPLPPKGPALLKKLNARGASTNSLSSPPTKHRQTLTLPPSPTRRSAYHYGYDNEPNLELPPKMTQAQHKNETKEAAHCNYLEMGSPKTAHRVQTTTTASTKTKVPLVTLPLPHRTGSNKTTAGLRKLRKDEYMDMGTVDLPGDEMLDCEDEDEIYLDVDETCKPREAYINARTEFPKTREPHAPPQNHTQPRLAMPEIKESTYVEMGKVLAPTPPKTSTLQNLETLQAYVNNKLEVDKTPAKPNHVVKTVLVDSHPPRPPSLRSRNNSDSESLRKAATSNAASSPAGKPAKSPMKIYTKVKASPQSVPSSPNTEPPAPFTNLMEFSKMKGDFPSPYLNTILTADNELVPHDFVPLPEPAKEGFLARLKRRSSKDRGTPVSDKPAADSSKNRNGALERSMSEHETSKSSRKEEKGSKIKLGRRRSSSFPNRLSFQEANNDESSNTLLAVGGQAAAESSSSFSSESSRSKPWQKGRCESFSSVHDFSDDSDQSPLLRHGKLCADHSPTVLHAQRNLPLIKDLFPSQSTSCLRSLSLDSSKTDDEKMIEIFHQHIPNYQTQSSNSSKSVHEDSYNETKDEYEQVWSEKFVCTSKSSSDVQKPQAPAEPDTDNYCEMNASLKKSPRPLWGNPGTDSSSSSPSPPALPPKNRSYQVLLSPVLESLSPLEKPACYIVSSEKQTAYSSSIERETGYSGSTERQTGYSGSTERQTGYSGSTERQTGYSGSTERQTGYSGSTERQTGYSGSTERQTGYSGSTERQTGYSGSTERQTGYSGSTERQTGYSGSTERQTGYSGSTERQTGYSGSTERQTGYSGSTERQTGYSGSTERQTGYSGSMERQTGYSGSTERQTDFSGSIECFPAGSSTLKSNREAEEDSLSDQYVELKGASDEESNRSDLNSADLSKAGRESIPSTSSSSTESKEVNPANAEYTTISLSVAEKPRLDLDSSDEDDRTVNGAAAALSSQESSIMPCGSVTVQRCSLITSPTTNGSDPTEDCVNAAKTILRPRSGKEYVVFKRVSSSSIPQTFTSSPPPSASLPSRSASSIPMFNYDLHSQHSDHHPYPCKSHHQHHHHHNHPVSSCNSLSLCSHSTSAQHTPQRSPSLASTIGTTQSHRSLASNHDLWDKEHSSGLSPHLPLFHSSRTSQHSNSQSALSSPYSSSSCSTLQTSPSLYKNMACPQSAPLEEEAMFFPADTANTSSPSLPLPSRRLGSCGSNSSSHNFHHHHNPIYVNQQFVDMYYSQRCNHGVAGSCRAANANITRSNSLTQGASYYHQQQPPQNCLSADMNSHGFNSLGRSIRTRNRHSESDALRPRADKHSKSFSLPFKHHHPSLTLPINVHRSHSDPKKLKRIEPGLNNGSKQSHLHGKEFDKFAQSSIIARRRQQHAEQEAAQPLSRGADSGEDQSSLSVSTPSMATALEASLSLQALSMRSSGYKNIDVFTTNAVSPDSPLNSGATTPVSTLFPSSSSAAHLENICESHQIPAYHNRPDTSHSAARLLSDSPPPLPMRQRLVSTPSSSPPLTPFNARSDFSDSPPPYDAPPPPPTYRTEGTGSSSSEDEQELNYIEIDMTARPPCDVEQPPLPFSRRSKRARQEKKLAKLRYAEIDHTATKALQDTGQEHAQSRRGGGLPSKSGVSLSRMNSAPASKGHKPLAVRERKPSTGSVESFYV